MGSKEQGKQPAKHHICKILFFSPIAWKMCFSCIIAQTYPKWASKLVCALYIPNLASIPNFSPFGHQILHPQVKILCLHEKCVFSPSTVYLDDQNLSKLRFDWIFVFPLHLDENSWKTRFSWKYSFKKYWPNYNLELAHLFYTHLIAHSLNWDFGTHFEPLDHWTKVQKVDP